MLGLHNLFPLVPAPFVDFPVCEPKSLGQFQDGGLAEVGIFLKLFFKDQLRIPARPHQLLLPLSLVALVGLCGEDFIQELHGVSLIHLLRQILKKFNMKSFSRLPLFCLCEIQMALFRL